MHPLRIHSAGLAAVAMLALFSACLPGCRGAVHAGKPGLPLTVEIAPSGELRRGEAGEVTVVADALTDGEFSLDVELPPGIALYSGDLHRRETVRANTRFRAAFVIRVPTEGNPLITARARLGAGEAGAFEAIASFRIGDDAAARSPPAPGRPAGRAGERLREFPLP